MKKNRFSIRTVLSFFSGLCIAGVFSLLFCLQPGSAYDSLKYDCSYTSGLFQNDVAAVYCHGRKNNLSGSKTLSADGNLKESLPCDSFVDLISLLPAHKSQTIYSGFNLNYEIIACTAPPRAGPRCL